MKTLLFLLFVLFICIGSQAQKIIKLPYGMQFNGEQSHLNSYSVLGTSVKDIKLILREGVYPELQKLPPINELQEFIPISLHIQSYHMAQQNGKLCYFLETGKKGRVLWMLFADGKLEKPLGKQDVHRKFRFDIFGKTELDLSLWPYADIPVNNQRPECRFENNFVYEAQKDSIRDLNRPCMTRKSGAEKTVFQPVQFNFVPLSIPQAWARLLNGISPRTAAKTPESLPCNMSEQKAKELKKILNGEYEKE